MARKILIFALGMILLAAVPRHARAQEAVKPVETNPSEIQWLWGEVVAVDPAAGNLTVKYLDYDTDEEKTMNLSVAEGTTFQEVKGLAGIKLQDTVSVEYTVRDGQSFAKDITVEKVEDADTGSDQMQLNPPEKVGTGPVKETEGPAQPQDKPQGQ
jgi:hypothetical protein